MSLRVSGGTISIVDHDFFVSDSSGTLIAKFDFDSSWDGFVKTAIFYRDPDHIYNVILNESVECNVPFPALLGKGRLFIGVFGIRKERRITSNLVALDIQKGAYYVSETPAPASLDVYAQIVDQLERVKKAAKMATAAANIATKAANDATDAAIEATIATKEATEATKEAAAAAREATQAANDATEAANRTTEAAKEAVDQANAAIDEANRINEAANEAVRVAAASAQASADSATASADSATASADSATASADSATASADSATASADSAMAARDAADEAGAYANRAEELVGKIKNLTVSAETLPPGSQATAEYTFDDSHIVFGIPRGDTGILPPPSSELDEDDPDQYASSKAVYELWLLIQRYARPRLLRFSGGGANVVPSRFLSNGNANTDNHWIIRCGGARKMKGV
jgi:hypothetical protein